MVEVPSEGNVQAHLLQNVVGRSKGYKGNTIHDDPVDLSWALCKQYYYYYVMYYYCWLLYCLIATEKG